MGCVLQEEGITELLEAPGKLADTIDGMSGTRNLDDNLSDLRAQVIAHPHVTPSCENPTGEDLQTVAKRSSSSLLSSLAIVSCLEVLRNSFSWLCDDSLLMPNFRLQGKGFSQSS